MSFVITATVTFDGTKPPYVRTWGPLEKSHVVDHMEMRWIRALGKLNDLATQVNHGKVPKPTTTNPVTMKMDLNITEDGALWCNTNMTWPKMGDEQQATLIGIFEGEIEHVGKEIKAKEHDKSGALHGKAK